MNKELQKQKMKFVDKLSLKMEENGQPRIAGQILGWLLICSPPEQSFSDLTENLSISKASVSNMTRLLIQLGLIEKVRLPGERQIHFKVKERAWRDLIDIQVQQVNSLKELSQEGLDILANDSETDKSRLKEMNKFYKFCSKQLPKLIQGYDE